MPVAIRKYNVDILSPFRRIEPHHNEGIAMADTPTDSAWTVLGARDRSNCYRVSESAVDMRRPAPEVRTVQVQAMPQNLLFDLHKTALIVVDMQNDFCAREGWLGQMGLDVSPALALAEPINRVTSALRAARVPVLWLNWGVRADRLNLSPGTQHPFNPNGRSPGLGGEVSGVRGTHKLLEQGSWGARLIDELVQDQQDIHIDKHRISGFWDTTLHAILSNLGVKTVMFAGVNTDHCVLATLMDANFHGYDTILLQDCTATTSPDFCFQATLHNVRFCFGFTTTSVDIADAVAAAI
jgi:ureidoacrylate peracid hydrolase